MKSELNHHTPNAQSKNLLSDLRSLIEQGKNHAVAAVNSTITATYWQVGKRINEEILQGERAEYGKQVVASLAQDLVLLYGKSFEIRNLRRMMQFAQTYPDFKIVSPLVSQLSWTHFTILISLASSDARAFYARHAMEGKWSKRELQHQIERKAFERAEIADSKLALAIMVAEYWTQLPSKKLLEDKLHTALIEVRERLAARKLLE